MAVAFGLLTALCWGTVDVLAATAARRGSSFPVVLGFQLTSSLFLVALATATGALGDASAGDLPFFVALGLLGATGYIAFYRALSIGPISVVSPIASGYAAVTVILAVLLAGERLSGAEASAVAVVFAGVALAAADVRRIREAGHVRARAIALTLLALVVFGAYVLGIAERVDELGWLLPVLYARIAATGFVVAAAAGLRELRLPRAPVALLAVTAAGVLDALGYVAFNLGAREADTSAVVTASAPYAVVPIAVGVLLFRERPTVSQWTGIATVVAGVVLLGLAS